MKSKHTKDEDPHRIGEYKSLDGVRISLSENTIKSLESVKPGLPADTIKSLESMDGFYKLQESIAGVTKRHHEWQTCGVLPRLPRQDVLPLIRGEETIFTPDRDQLKSLQQEQSRQSSDGITVNLNMTGKVVEINILDMSNIVQMVKDAWNFFFSR